MPLTPSSPLITSTSYALVVDDHPLVAEGARQLLQSLPSVGQVLLCESCYEALSLIASMGAPVLTVVDFWLDGQDSSCFIKDMLSLAPRTRILMTSGDTHPGLADKARTAGAHGFIGKSRPATEFLQAAKALLSEQVWFTADSNNDDWQPPTRLRMSARDLGITVRQSQVLALILKGKPNRFIADSLNLSEHTVKEHVTALLQRLGAANRVELITRLQTVDLES